MKWQGEVLGAGPIAFVLLDDETARFVAAAAAEPNVAYVLDTAGLVAFLLRHGQSTLVCHDAAIVHWRLHGLLAGAGAEEAVACLWDYSRDHRLVDVMLLDQRARLAQDGRHILPRPLGAIASERCGISIGTKPHARELTDALLSIYQSLQTEIASILSSPALGDVSQQRPWYYPETHCIDSSLSQTLQQALGPWGRAPMSRGRLRLKPSGGEGCT